MLMKRSCAQRVLGCLAPEGGVVYRPFTGPSSKASLVATGSGGCACLRAHRRSAHSDLAIERARLQHYIRTCHFEHCIVCHKRFMHSETLCQSASAARDQRIGSCHDSASAFATADSNKSCHAHVAPVRHGPVRLLGLAFGAELPLNHSVRRVLARHLHIVARGVLDRPERVRRRQRRAQREQ